MKSFKFNFGKLQDKIVYGLVVAPGEFSLTLHSYGFGVSWTVE